MLLLSTAQNAPAGGAEIFQVVVATLGAGIASALLIVLGLGHRSGRVTVLQRAADRVGGLTGMPGWATLPSFVATASLVTAGLGMYWDISLHIDNGRDPGPLANPSHYLILGGLFGILAAGWLATVLPKGEKPGPVSIALTKSWHAPLGGILLMVCGSFSLIAFPLDDVSHRFFGQDVTLWGPTHLMLLGGAALSLIAILVLLGEGHRAAESKPVEVTATAERVRLFRYVSAYGGLLIGLSIFQGEYDFGVPQFRLLFQPPLIALAAAFALVAARSHLGRGAAFGAVAFFLAVRGSWSLIVGEGLGEVMPHFPLYIAEAFLVEGLALLIRRPLTLGLAGGAAIGTLGTLAEYGWSHVWMWHAWPSHILPEAVVLATIAGLAGGVMGGFLVECLTRREGAERLWPAPVGSIAALLAIGVYLFPTEAPRASAQVEMDRAGNATVRIVPAEAAQKADWLTAIAWQGEDKLKNRPLEELSPGVYRTREPLPTDGSWKTMIRLHKGEALGAIPVYLPEDPEIPAKAVEAAPRFERTFLEDKQILQRERKDDVPGWLWGLAGAIVLGIYLTVIGIIGWALTRFARATTTESPRDGADDRRAGPRSGDDGAQHPRPSSPRVASSA